MKTVINKTTYTCDKCHKKITDVVYSLFCYATTVSEMPSLETVTQNIRQNLAEEKHLCRECKESITDGEFIV